MTPLSAYRSDHPDVLGAWNAAQRAANAYRASMFAILAVSGLPDCEVSVSTSGFRPWAFRGLVVPPGQELPLGWRWLPDYDRTAVPDKRTKAGKRVAAQLEELNPPTRMSLPGMPGQVAMTNDLGRRVFTPGAECLEGDTAVWMTWGTVLDAATDLDMSTPVEAAPEFWQQKPLAAWREARAHREDAPGE